MASGPLSTSKKKKLKFLCSYGGKILPRPRDRRLRYVGGETQIIEISDDTSWEDLRQELMAMYGQPHTVKYQLPGQEDFSCLPSVSGDDDLEDLMEHGVVDGGGSEELIRVFLFPSDGDGHGHLGLAVEGDSKSQYVFAVNGIVVENTASGAFRSRPPVQLLNHLSKAEAARWLDEADKYLAPRAQRSSPAALEDVKPSKLQLVQNPSAVAHETIISEYPESATEESRGIIIDTLVGKTELSNTQMMDYKDLVVLKRLGSGGFGTVYHGTWRGVHVAIKKIHKGCFADQLNEKNGLILDTFREAGILASIHHPNIVNFYGLARDVQGESLAIVTELMADGSLRDIMRCEDKYRDLDYRKRLIITTCAATGMEYLHLRNIIHFDLKCDNLLVDLQDPSRPICKVTDFGLSKVKQGTMISGGFRGTLPWMAPELLRDRSKVSEKVDVFSFGIVMWEILTGEVPYADMSQVEILGGMYENKLRPPVPASCNPKWKRLMEECWAPDPGQRPPFSRITVQLRSMLVDIEGEPNK